METETVSLVGYQSLHSVPGFAQTVSTVPPLSRYISPVPFQL